MKKEKCRGYSPVPHLPEDVLTGHAAAGIGKPGALVFSPTSAGSGRLMSTTGTWPDILPGPTCRACMKSTWGDLCRAGFLALAAADTDQDDVVRVDLDDRDTCTMKKAY